MAGGFASTVCWPIHVAVVLPLYLLDVPHVPRRVPQAARRSTGAAVEHVQRAQRVSFWLLAAGFTLASVIMTVISVHLLTLLEARGVALAGRLAWARSLGPARSGQAARLSD